MVSRARESFGSSTLPDQGVPGTLGGIISESPRSEAWRRDGRPSNRIRIRARRPDDLQALFSIYSEQDFIERALMRDPFEDCRQFEHWLAGFSTMTRGEIVAELNDKCVGFGSVYVMNEHFNHCGVLALGVLSQARGQGVGQMLLTAIIQTSIRFLYLKRLQLTVLIDNFEAINLYVKNGFICEGKIYGYVRRGDQLADAYLMAMRF